MPIDVQTKKFSKKNINLAKINKKRVTHLYLIVIQLIVIRLRKKKDNNYSNFTQINYQKKDYVNGNYFKLLKIKN